MAWEKLSGVRFDDIQPGDYVQFSPRFGRIREDLMRRIWKVTEINERLGALRIVNRDGLRDLVPCEDPNHGIQIIRCSWK